MDRWNNIEDKLCDIITLLSLISNKIADIVEEIPEIRKNYRAESPRPFSSINSSQTYENRNHD